MQELQNKLGKTLRPFNALGPVATIFGAVNTGAWRYERPVVDAARCLRCGVCGRYCPVDAITVQKSGDPCVDIMWEFCKGCGICANECPQKCIIMEEEGNENG
ncbi:MAG: 4Fe-4S binding protein [Oscillospiraceae bacterium]|jgi:2-oxoacid:acceptor oxidoreductase delta subunit (pyruvate/2-ketoisovalerate family)|nr:4Fe-4S binding protein [Oscillospiraceae bacterium]